MKKMLSLVLLAAFLLTAFSPAAGAADSYDGKVVLVYTSNVRGDVDVYAEVASICEKYTMQGAEVLLLDGGNHLQGTAYANSDRGELVYQLMDAAGYDAVAMGPYDFAYGGATTGYPYHGNFHKYYTQAELYRGAEELTYNVNGNGSVTDMRPAKAPAKFKVICSNLHQSEEGVGYYAFDQDCVLQAGGLRIGVVYELDIDATEQMLQDGWLDGYYPFGDVNLPECDIMVNLGADKFFKSDICLPTGDGFLWGAYVIDPATKAITHEEVTKTGAPKAEIASLAAEGKAKASPVVGTSKVTLNGADRCNRAQETNLGDLVTDALKWYAENRFDGFQKDVPVIAIQNGGNCDQFLYPGEITQTDLLCALPFSPMGVGIVYVTGAQLLEILESATQSQPNSGWAQVAGLEYEVALYNEYDAGEAYGNFYKAKSIQRVTIKSVGGKAFDEKATYAVIADKYLINGSDTYYSFPEITAAEGAIYLDNGNGTKTRDIVALYVQKVLGGTIGQEYAQPKGRITLVTQPEKPEFVNPFTDVQKGQWYYNAVQYVAREKLMKGLSKTVFGPKTDMNRAMMVTVLYRLEGRPEASEYENPFTDVDDGTWYTDAVCWAAANGLAAGYGNGMFAPKELLTREQMARFFYNYAAYKHYDMTPSAPVAAFPDAASLSGWAKTPMQWAVAVELISGVKAGSQILLAPQATANRAQLAMVLMHFQESVVK